ncbi:hypothetical protein ACIQ1D_19705 [Lysinibacillus xylanilyticus]|uniref:hypothetical protein n=1 Tax=Lysinibacillus xylanilyticus TaxID=582475 RepID=UPI00381A646A
MIKDMDIRCQFYGEKFSPKVVEQLIGIKLENTIEVGDISKIGRNNGKPSDYGNVNYVLQRISKNLVKTGRETQNNSNFCIHLLER